MANFTLRFANRSHSTQDWMIHTFDNFQLDPDYVRSADVRINHDYTFRIVVSTDGGFAHADLSYNAETNVWSIQTNTPNEWQIEQGNETVTVRCFLEDQNAIEQLPQYDSDDTETKYNWSAVQTINPPIQATSNDVVMSGHGSFEFKGETLVPEGIEFCVLAPLGASISDSLGQMIESGSQIKKLGLKSKSTNDLINVQQQTYNAGDVAPNYILHAPRGIIIKPGIPHIIGVEKSTELSDLWIRVQPFIKPGKTIKVFWAACSAIRGAKNQVVLGK